MKCYVCENYLTKENETEEHILLNAIGGKLKSRALLCKDCNSKFGSKIDDKLAQQLNPIVNLLNVKRDRGKPQNIKGKYGNRDIIIEPNGNMKLARTYIDKGEKLAHIEASSLREATKALEGLKRAYPHLNIEEAIKNAKRSKDYLPYVTVNMNFGGKEIKQSICKMAVNFYIFQGGDPKIIKHLLPFIEGKKEDEEVYYFYPRSEVFYKGDKDIMHTLLLVGDPLKKQLYVYIELFNEFKMVVYLNREYDGEPINKSYHFNVVTNEIVQYDTTINIPPKHLRKYCSKELVETKFKERMMILLKKIDELTTSRRINEISTKAIEELQKKYPKEKNPVFTEEMSRFLSNRVSEEFVSSFQHSLFKREK
ncbi:HNH endonuclease [Neobacillus pocheonensis]|uniref:HNH endonuclease n=1 Tax=Neobacillus pocheonensis TaxID=363869 RepID=A0ABT0WGL3_9BACI|nr:HNH endonuclease [Neobacillus pocheonensis]